MVVNQQIYIPMRVILANNSKTTMLGLHSQCLANGSSLLLAISIIRQIIYTHDWNDTDFSRHLCLLINRIPINSRMPVIVDRHSQRLLQLRQEVLISGRGKDSPELLTNQKALVLSVQEQ